MRYLNSEDVVVFPAGNDRSIYTTTIAGYIYSSTTYENLDADVKLNYYPYGNGYAYLGTVADSDFSKQLVASVFVKDGNSYSLWCLTSDPTNPQEVSPYVPAYTIDNNIKNGRELDEVNLTSIFGAFSESLGKKNFIIDGSVDRSSNILSCSFVLEGRYFKISNVGVSSDKNTYAYIEIQDGKLKNDTDSGGKYQGLQVISSTEGPTSNCIQLTIGDKLNESAKLLDLDGGEV